MPSYRTNSAGHTELRISDKRIECDKKQHYSTWLTKSEAEGFYKYVMASLDAGIYPPELRMSITVKRERKVHLSTMLGDYLDDSNSGMSYSARPLTQFLKDNLNVYIQDINVDWVAQWVTDMKRKEKLAPGTIRKRMSALGIAYHWWLRKNHGAEKSLPGNPLRMLPEGYSTYSEEDEKIAGVRVVDRHRDRRLEPGEFERIEAVINGNVRKDKQRKIDIPYPEDFLLMWRLIVNTGLRLREAYRLRWVDVQFHNKSIHVYKSKTKSTRDAPMTKEVYVWLKEAEKRKLGERVFPFWDGEDTDKSLNTTTAFLSSKFGTIFNYADCPNLTEHDLRHEAVCRWVLMKNKTDGWMFRTEEVRKITGHKTESQFMRYLSLRGSDLADRLW